MDQYQEHCDFNYSSPAEWDRYEASLAGEANPDQAWICSGRDAWYANPYYQGKPQLHPEDLNSILENASYEDWDDATIDAEIAEAEAALRGGK